MLAVIVRFVVKDGYQQRFAERVRQQAADTLAYEPDCQQFDVCQDASNPCRLLLYELYTGADAFARHVEASHFVVFDAETREWVERKDVEQWERQEV